MYTAAVQHNHEIGSEVIKHNASNRKLSVQEQQELNEVLELRPNNKQLKDYIHMKYKKVVTLKDIQESKMSILFEKFPEILLVDGTYNVNRARMPLCCFMVEDGFGNGRNVHYSATAEEGSVRLLQIIQTFKSFNPSWFNVRVIVIDKDFTELPALEQEFPQASVFFCQFHVTKYLFKQIVDLDVAKENRELARESIRRLVNADNEESYAALKQELYDNTNHAFQGYFIKNWDVCREKWVKFLRDDHLRFANTTNSHLECHNHKLKDVVSRSMLISDMFEKVLLFCRTNATEYSHKLFVEQFSTSSMASDSIPGVADIYSTCTAYSAEKIVEQLKLSHSVKYTIAVGGSDGAFVAVYKSHQHHVSLTSNCCSCSFSKVMGLPCRHVFAVRTSQNLPVFHLQLVARRWHTDYQLTVDPSQTSYFHSEQDCSATVKLSTIVTKGPSMSTLSKNQKYKKALGLGQKLAALTSECGMSEFKRKILVMENLFNYWESNCDVEIVPLQETEVLAPVNSVSDCSICMVVICS